MWFRVKYFNKLSPTLPLSQYEDIDLRISVSHCFPVNLSGHWHIYPSPCSMHVPPFLHGILAHGLGRVVAVQKINNKSCVKKVAKRVMRDHTRKVMRNVSYEIPL